MPLPSTQIVHPARTSTVAAVVDQVRPEVGTLKRRTFVKSAVGGDTETLAVVARNVAYRARVQGRRAIAGESGGEATEAERWELSFANGTDVRTGDRFYGASRTWDVLSAGSESLEPEVRALCVEVTS